MEPNEKYSVDDLTNCRFSGKWTPLVIFLLRDSPQRYTQIKRQINGISQKMLTQTLRQLEEAEIVTRTIYPTVPPTVEYALTSRGKALLEPFLGMIEGGNKQK
ncbi:MAG: helix-turn-helix domain-containing protein [Chloroflexota bacterium]